MRKSRLDGTLSRPIRFGALNSDVEGHTIERQIEVALGNGRTPAASLIEPITSCHSQPHLAEEEDVDPDAAENARIAHEFNTAHEREEFRYLICIGHVPCYAA